MIKDIIDELDNKFLTNPEKKISYISGDEKRELIEFITEELKKVYEQGRKDMKEEILSKLEEYFDNKIKQIIEKV